MSMHTILEYLSELEQNNNRDWYHANKARYQAANLAFETLLDELIARLREMDGSIPPLKPREITFKLVRDTRFSHDKSPYMPAFRAHIGPRGKLPVPVGYYLMIKPGGRSFLGGGLFADMFKDATVMVRDSIAARGDEWQRLVSAPAFTEFCTVEGTALKNVPRGYDADHPQAAYLKHKSWYIEVPISDEQLLGTGFVRFAVDVFGRMQPVNAFLNRALEGFQMPSR